MRSTFHLTMLASKSVPSWNFTPHPLPEGEGISPQTASHQDKAHAQDYFRIDKQCLRE
jgi:hypothetical protein